MNQDQLIKLLKEAELYKEQDIPTITQFINAVNQLHQMKEALSDNYLLTELNTKGETVTKANPLLKPINDLYVIVLRYLKELNLTTQSRKSDAERDVEAQIKVRKAVTDWLDS
ncbi:P27 family phage terminase small subunit [Vibrio alginolyticus]